MTLAQDVRTSIAAIATAHTKIEEDTKEIKRRFFAFLDESKIPQGYADYPWSLDYHSSVLDDIDSYYLVTGYDNPEGLVFCHDTYDGTEAVVVPYSYLEDPDAWEKNVIVEVSTDRKFVEKSLDRYGLAGNFTIVGIRLAGNPDNRALDIELTPLEKGVSIEFYNISVNRTTGDLVYISSSLVPFMEEAGKA